MMLGSPGRKSKKKKTTKNNQKQTEKPKPQHQKNPTQTMVFPVAMENFTVRLHFREYLLLLRGAKCLIPQISIHLDRNSPLLVSNEQAKEC